MFMPFILILIGAIGLGVFWGYPKYQIMQLEDETRLSLKSGGFGLLEARYQPIMRAAKIDFTVLDQYPNIRFYMRNIEYTGQEVPADVDLMIKTMACESLESFRELEEKARIATLNILEEDQITFHMSVKNKLGLELVKHEQKLSSCPNFLQLKNLKEGDPITAKPSSTSQVPMVAPAVSASTEDRAASH